MELIVNVKQNRLVWFLLLILLSTANSVYALSVSPSELESASLETGSFDVYYPQDSLPLDDLINETAYDTTDSAKNPTFGNNHQLSNKEWRAIMISALQTGEIAGAIAIANKIEKHYPNDAHIKAVQAMEAALEKNYQSAASKLKAISTDDKYERSSQLIASAFVAIQQQDDKRAGELLKTLSKTLPQHAYAKVLQASLALNQGASGEPQAAELLQQALTINPNMRIGLINAGKLALKTGNYQQAATYFARLRTKNDTCLARVGEAQAQSYLAHYDDAMQLISECTQHEESGIRQQSITILANAYLERGDYSQAEQLISTLSAADSQALRLIVAKVALYNADMDTVINLEANNEPALLLLQALALIEQGRYDDARIKTKLLQAKSQASDISLFLASTLDAIENKNLSTALKSLDEHSRYRQLLQFYQALTTAASDIDKAVALTDKLDQLIIGMKLAEINQDKRRALLLNADRVNIVTGLLFYQFELSPLALKHLEQSAKTSTDFISQYLSAKLADEANRGKLALESIEKARLNLPQQLAVHQLHASILLKQSQLKPALDALKRSLAIKPDPFTALKAGAVAERLGELPEAERLYEKVISLAPDNFIGLNQLAWFYANHRMKLDRGITLAEKALALSPGSPNLLDTLGWLHVQKGELQQAQSIFQKAIKQSNNSPGHSILYHLAYVEAELGNHASAQELLQALLKSPNNGKYRESAQQLLAEITQ